MKMLFLGLFFSVSAFAIQQADHPGEEKAVYQAILDYVEGIYNGEPERIQRSVHPQMRKHGFYIQDGAYTEVPMTFERLVKLAATFKKEGRIPADATFEITIFEVMDQTASAKLTAFWGMDYFHLAKFDGKWMITNVLWQSLPSEK